MNVTILVMELSEVRRWDSTREGTAFEPDSNQVMSRSREPNSFRNESASAPTLLHDLEHVERLLAAAQDRESAGDQVVGGQRAVDVVDLATIHRRRPRLDRLARGTA